MSTFRNINLVEKNNTVVNNKIVLFFINLFFNFPIKYIFKYSKINYLYKIDSLYFYENYNQVINSIFPVILSFKLVKNKSESVNDKLLLASEYTKLINDKSELVNAGPFQSDLDELELIDKIKMYDANVPIKIFFINENIDIDKYDNVVIKTLKSKSLTNFIIKDIINYKICDFLKNKYT